MSERFTLVQLFSLGLAENIVETNALDFSDIPDGNCRSSMADFCGEVVHDGVTYRKIRTADNRIVIVKQSERSNDHPPCSRQDPT